MSYKQIKAVEEYITSFGFIVHEIQMDDWISGIPYGYVEYEDEFGKIYSISWEDAWYNCFNEMEFTCLLSDSVMKI